MIRLILRLLTTILLVGATAVFVVYDQIFALLLLVPAALLMRWTATSNLPTLPLVQSLKSIFDPLPENPKGTIDVPQGWHKRKRH